MSATHLSGPLYVAGVPVAGFAMPAILNNKVFFVDKDYGSDSRDGETPETAFATIEAGYAALRTNRHDVLVLSANASHTLSDQLLISKNRIHIVSADFEARHYGQSTKVNLGVTTGSTIAAINNQGVRNSFRGLKVTSSNTLASSNWAVAECGEFSIWEWCEILKDTNLTEAGAGELLHNGDSCVFRHCAIGNGIYTPTAARQNVLFTRETVTGKVARDVYFNDCIFMHRAGATTVVNCRAATNDLERLALFENCKFIAVKTSTATQAVVWGITSALTDAQVLLKDCSVLNITDVCDLNLGVFTNSVTPVATATEAVSVDLS